MKTLRIILFSAVAMVAMVGCSSTFYASSAYDDMYYTHSADAISQKQIAEAEARQAEAEARRAEALAQQAEWKAQAALYEAEAQRAAAGVSAGASQRVDSDGIIIVDDDYYYDDNPYSGVVANTYESAYARRLRGFSSSSYRMPSSYYTLRYGNQITYATAYDPAFYNIMVSGDQVWVEPKFITSMFGTWGAVSVTASVYAPWYSGWSIRFDPWYYSWYGYPRYSWYDWNWNVCYGGGWHTNLWWGWGGYYRPWRPYYYDYYWGWNHYHHYYPHYHYHPVRPYNPHQPSFSHGSRRGSRFDGRNSGIPSRGGEGIAGRGSVGGSRQTPYRSPSSGQTYGDTSSRSEGTALRDGTGSRGRGVSSGSSVRSGSSSSRGSVSGGTRVNSSSSSSSSRGSRSGVTSGSSSSGSRSSYSSGSSSRSGSSSSRSSYSSGSSSRSSYSSGSSSRSGGGGGSRSGGGSRGR